MPNQFVWVDIPVTDIDRAIAFYEAVLACSIHKEEFPGGSMGILPHAEQDASSCLVQTADSAPGQVGPLLYLNVDGRLDAAVALVEANGGSVTLRPESIGPHGFRAIILDSEGNRIAHHSS